MAEKQNEELIQINAAYTVFVKEDQGDLFLIGPNPDDVAETAKLIQKTFSGFCGIIPFESGNIVIATSLKSAIKRIGNQIRNLPNARKYTLTEKGVQAIEDCIEESPLDISKLRKQARPAKGKRISIRNHPSGLPPSLKDIIEGMFNGEQRSYVTTWRGSYIISFSRDLSDADIDRTKEIWEKVYAEEIERRSAQTPDSDYWEDIRSDTLKNTSRLASTYTVAFAGMITADRNACMDCGVNTLEIDHYYMLIDETWEKIHPRDMGMLCIPCAERRLGRKLNATDFTDAPINGIMARACDVLYNRLTNQGS